MMYGLVSIVFEHENYRIVFAVFVLFQIVIKVLWRIANFEKIKNLFKQEYMTEEDEIWFDNEEGLGTFNNEDLNRLKEQDYERDVVNIIDEVNSIESNYSANSR